MSDWKTHVTNTVLEHAPFLVGATSPGVNTTRLMEAVLIAGATALLTSVLTADKVATRLEERVAALTLRVARCEAMHDANVEAHAEFRERLALCGGGRNGKTDP